MATKLILTKKPKNVTIIEGFPGIGLIGTIATQFLNEHLKTENIGKITIDDVPAMIAVHGSKVVEPISISYNKEYNIVIIHAISLGKGVGWDIAEVINDVAKQLNAKEIICIEGVGSGQEAQQSRVFFYSTNDKKKKSLSGMAKPLVEGIVVGVTGALLANKDGKIPITAFFGETHSNLPDSKASANIIKALDDYLKLKVDPKPLFKQAEEFESKLKTMMMQTKQTSELQKAKTLDYLG